MTCGREVGIPVAVVAVDSAIEVEVCTAIAAGIHAVVPVSVLVEIG